MNSLPTDLALRTARRVLVYIIVASVCFATGTAFAHKLSDSYLFLQVIDDHVTGEWHLALRDLDDAIGIDTDENGLITWKELREHRAAIETYATSRLHIGPVQEPGRIHVTDLLVDHHSDGAYAVLRFTLGNFRVGPTLEVQYQAFFDVDPSHRGLLRLQSSTGLLLAVFGPHTAVQRCELGSVSHATNSPGAFLREGIWHIWTGYDHVLFLVALLLAAAWPRLSGAGETHSVRSVLAEILKTVTGFTAAHSITLTLAALGWVRLPARGIECAIAASVLLAALNNLWPWFRGRGWVLAFTFGLIHGFGFANALADLGLQRAHLAAALVQFNVGVELGQLTIVALCLPLLLPLRSRPVYRGYLLPAGSLAIALLAAVWVTERLCDTKWLPF